MRASTWFLIVAMLAAAGSRAEVLDSQSTGFTVSRRIAIAAPPATVWAALGRMSAWWDGEHTFSGDARNLSIELKPGAAFLEKLPSGGAVRHMVVVYADPGKMLRLEGGLGPLQAFGVNGALTFVIKPNGTGAILVETYDVGGHAPGGLDKLATTVDTVINHQVDRLAAYAEGRPLP